MADENIVFKKLSDTKVTDMDEQTLVSTIQSTKYQRIKIDDIKNLGPFSIMIYQEGGTL